MEEESIVTSLAWVRKGFAANVPKQFMVDDDAWEEMRQDPDVQEEMKMDVEDEFNLKNYDDEESVPSFAQETRQILTGSRKKDQYPDFIDEESEDEKEDYNIRDTDSVVIAGKIEKHEFSTLEVYVYEDTKSNLYIHHDITLSAFPLCLEWLCIRPFGAEDTKSKRGNFAIVGTFLPEIEIWDLDTLDAIEPTLTLGGEETATTTKKKKGPKKFQSQSKTMKSGSHTDSVITLNLNPFRKEILASGSADRTVKLWDISKNACVFTYTKHQEKIQTVKWSAKEESVLATGAMDRTIKIFDVRQSDEAFTGKLDSDIECLTWDPHSPCNFVVGMEDGTIKGFDARKLSTPLYYLRAHSKNTTAVMVSPANSGMLATASHDGYVRIWDLNTMNDGQLKLIAEKHMKSGKLNCGSFYEDLPSTLACGNNKGELVIWDVTENKAIVDHFSLKGTEGTNMAE